MQNRVKVYINQKEYVIATSENEGYVLDLAAQLDNKINDFLTQNEEISVSAAAILSALTYLDEATKAVASADNMREQIKSYLEDAAKATMDAQKAKAQLERLEKKHAKLEEELARLTQNK